MKKILFIKLFFFLALISCKQRVKKEMKVTKEAVALVSTNKTSFKEEVKCIDYIDENEVKIYPIDEVVTNDYKFYNKIKSSELNMLTNEKLANISCEGITYRIKCFENIDYLLIPTQECGNYETYLAIIKKNKLESLIKLSGTISSFESLNYVLNKDYLQVEKTNFYEYMATGKQDQSKIIKSIFKYKFTENGLVEF